MMLICPFLGQPLITLLKIMAMIGSQIKRDENLETKQRIIDQLSREGYIDKVKAQLRSEVVRVLEKEKKSAFGGASKYLK